MLLIYSLTVKLLTEHRLEFLSLKGGCTGSSECTHVKMPHLLEITCHVSFYLELCLVLFTLIFQEFLQPVLAGEQPLHCAEAKGYGNFTVQFLHTCVSKLKKETDKTNTRKLLIAAEHCCSCYVKVWDKLTLDDDYTVPKLVYHVLNSVKHKVSSTLCLFFFPFTGLSLAQNVFPFTSHINP